MSRKHNDQPAKTSENGSYVRAGTHDIGPGYGGSGGVGEAAPLNASDVAPAASPQRTDSDLAQEHVPADKG